jgi:hypothetical protein
MSLLLLPGNMSCSDGNRLADYYCFNNNLELVAALLSKEDKQALIDYKHMVRHATLPHDAAYN